MSRRIWLVVGLVGMLLLAMVSLVSAQESGPEALEAALGTAFTYQGYLKNNGNPVNESCDFQLYLYDSLAGNGQIGSTVSRPGIQVVNGYFMITNVDFGSTAFNGDARWLRIDVRCPAGSGGYTTLTPRQPLTPAPYALALPGLYTQQNATSPNVIGGYSGNIISSTVSGSVIGGGGNGMDLNRIQNHFAVIGGGAGNLARGYASTIGGGYYNEAAGDGSVIGGGGYDGSTVRGNKALSKVATIGGGHGNVISLTADYATVGGGANNYASGAGAFIGGGGYNGGDVLGNRATGDGSTVCGGVDNDADGYEATVGGGAANTASGDWATVGGGYHNLANGTNSTVGGGSDNRALNTNSSVGGGLRNTASNNSATVIGGLDNQASGYASTAGGGFHNAATGDYSFAAGHYAEAAHDGAFVWSDASSSVTFTSSANNQFLIQAVGGVGINTNSTYTNALTVNGRVIAGGTGVPTGSAEPFVARGSNAGLSLDDRSDATERWVVYVNNGSWRLWNGADRLLINSSGVVTLTALGSAGSTTLCRNAANQIATCSSSIRYKNNIDPLDLGLETVAQLQPVTFDWNDSGEHDLGFVAEDVDEITPLLTTRNAEGQVEGVKYDRISAVLVKAVQEQQQQIAALQQQNAELQAQLANLDVTAASASFNVFNLLSVLALAAVGAMIWQQQRAKRGER